MQPRKSKALIITFVVVLGLLIGGYFLVVRGGILKSDSNIGKKFAPLLGTPKQKDVVVGGGDTGTDTTTPQSDTTTPPETPPTDPGTNGGTTGGGSGGLGTTTPPVSKYTPPNLSFPQPKISNYKPQNATSTTECSDGKDNDKDGSIDSADNDCHYDGNALNLVSYVASYSKELGSKNAPIVPAKVDPKKKIISCDTEEVPLVFTAEEQARLDELTRQFYRLAPQLKSANDIVAEINAEQGYSDLIDTAKSLTTQCYNQTSTASYLRNNIDTENMGKQKVLVANATTQNDPGLYKDILSLAQKGGVVNQIKNLDIKDILKDIKGYVNKLKAVGIDIFNGNAAQIADKMKTFASNVKSVGKNWQDENIYSMVAKLQALGVNTAIDLVGTEVKLVKLGIDPKANIQTVLAKLEELGITDRVTTIPDKYQDVDVMNLSGTNKGRTERVAGPYSSSVIPYGVSVVGSGTAFTGGVGGLQVINIDTEPTYFGTYYIHPVTKKFITIWSEWEKDWGVW